MPEAKRNEIAKAVQRLGKERGVKAVWKWESEEMNGSPDNVLLKKWLPQQDLIGHSKTKLFITHGGLMSTMEAIYHGKPMIVMPGFADQVKQELTSILCIKILVSVLKCSKRYKKWLRDNSPLANIIIR